MFLVRIFIFETMWLNIQTEYPTYLAQLPDTAWQSVGDQGVGILEAAVSNGMMSLPWKPRSDWYCTSPGTRNSKVKLQSFHQFLRRTNVILRHNFWAIPESNFLLLVWRHFFFLKKTLSPYFGGKQKLRAGDPPEILLGGWQPWYLELVLSPVDQLD